LLFRSPIGLRDTEQLGALAVHSEPLETSAHGTSGADRVTKMRRHVLEYDRFGERARPRAPLAGHGPALAVALRGRDHDLVPLLGRIPSLHLPELEVVLLGVVAPSGFEAIVMVLIRSRGHVGLDGRLGHI